MKQLVVALYVEGPTDARFLPRIIGRTAEHLLAGCDVDILDPIVINGDIHRLSTLPAQIVAAAQRTHGYHILIVHQDADAPSEEAALRERIQPGLDAVRQQLGAYQQTIIPLIPVRMVEAWMLSDPDALCHALPGCSALNALGLPDKPQQVERIQEPKAELQRIVKIYGSRRRRRSQDSQLARLQEPLANAIALPRLERVPSYQAFVQRFSQALRDLHFDDA